QSKVGTLITKENLQKGDLLFFGSSANNISHCGIYIGDGKMIHASTPETGIIISGAYKSGNLPLQVIRRVI
ncbi:MAG: C40 family peptidase, partial [Candidatus Niameybacter stercoravium]|nr:C40 family peptidase [Candidatus Niameybacter stercoravium]